jgi:hypothetical protein
MSPSRLSVVRHGKGWAVKSGDDFIGLTRRREDAELALAVLMMMDEPPPSPALAQPGTLDAA